MRRDIVNQIAPTFDRLIEVISGFDHESFNAVPFEGSWTAGQCVQHIKLSGGTIIDVLEGSVEKASRDPEEKVAQVAGLFLDFDTKMKSPEFIDPEMKTYDAQRFINFFSKFKINLDEAANRLDLSQVCLDFEIPGFGPMTRFEWIAFVLFHTQRHVRQLEKISDAVLA